MTTAVGVIGVGAIGSVVAEAIARGEVPGCRLAGVLRRSGAAGIEPRASPGHAVPTAPVASIGDPVEAPGAPALADHGPAVVASGLDLLVASIGELVDRSDVVVEAAGAQALADHGPTVVDAGLDLLVVSVGALVDDRLRAHLCETHEGRGRLLLSSGAIGGLDLLRAAALMGPVHSVRLTTVKRPQALERPWMSDDERTQLLRARHPHTVFSGSARDAVQRFPDSSNVAATLALATTGFDATHVDIVAEAEAARVRHRIEVEADAGRYELTVENTPSANPRTSAVTPYAVLRALADRDARLIVGA